MTGPVGMDGNAGSGVAVAPHPPDLLTPPAPSAPAHRTGRAGDEQGEEPDRQPRLITHSSRRRSGLHLRPRKLVQPLPIILAAQAGLSLRLVWRNTAFSDESLYLWAGRLEWAHWLHGMPVPDFPTYFSGAPTLYPPLAALVNTFGGLAAARLLSLVFMLGTTALLYATASRLFGRMAAGSAAAVFAVLGPVQFLGALATFDAMAVFLMALAAWCAVRSSGDHSEVYLIGCGLALALGDATKYASVLWTPVVLAVIALAPTSSSWGRAMLRACRCLMYSAAPILVALFGLGGEPYVKGILFTTLARQADNIGASASTVFSDSFDWVGLVLLLAVAGTVISFVSAGPTRWLCLVLTLAVVIGPLHQAQIHTTTSLQKHVVFGAWFGALVAGYLLARATEVNGVRGWRIGAVAAGIALCIGFPQATNLFVYGWPDTTRMNHDLAQVIPAKGCPCLIAQQDAVQYYLPAVASGRSITGPFSIWYRSRLLHRELHGIPAYVEAVKEHYFSVVEMDPAENPAIYSPVVQALDTTSGFRLDASIPIEHWGDERIEIWTDGPGRQR